MHTYKSAIFSFCRLEAVSCPQSTSRCPNNSKLVPQKHCGNFGTSSVSHHSFFHSGESIQDEGWTTTAHPQRGRIGTAEKGKKLKAQSFIQRGQHRSVSSCQSLSLFVLYGFVSALCVQCLVWCWPKNLLWKPHKHLLALSVWCYLWHIQTPHKNNSVKPNSDFKGHNEAFHC